MATMYLPDDEEFDPARPFAGQAQRDGRVDARFTRVDADRKDTATVGKYERDRFAYDLCFPPTTVQAEFTQNGYTMGDEPTGGGHPFPQDTAGERGRIDNTPGRNR